MESLEVIQTTIDYTEMLLTINENIEKNNNLIQELLNKLDSYNIPIILMLVVFSLALLVACAMFDD